jgi:uncharacterized membrane protein
VAVLVANRDYANWEERMNPWPVDAEVEERAQVGIVHAENPPEPLEIFARNLAPAQRREIVADIADALGRHEGEGLQADC